MLDLQVDVLAVVDRMPIGAFRVSQDAENRRDIRFEIASNDPVPEEQIRLRDSVDQTLTVLRILFPDGDARFNEYFRPLLSLAQAGLVGDTAQPEVSTRALNALKDEITAREGGRIKNQYMKLLGKHAFLLGLVSFSLALFIRWVTPDYLRIANFLFLWSGCMAGVWLSFGARKTYFRFEDLHIPEQDRLEPLVRLVFAGLLTIILGLMFSTKALTITLGSVDTTQFTNSTQIALLIGMLCGFSEQALSSQIARHASSFLEGGNR